MGKRYLVIKPEPKMYRLCREMPEQMQDKGIVVNGIRYYSIGTVYESLSPLLYRLQTARNQGDKVAAMDRRLAFLVENAEELLKRRRSRKAQNAGSRFTGNPAASQAK